MVSQDLKQRVGQQPGTRKVAYLLMFTGMMIMIASFVIGIAVGLSTADFFENTKAARDAAAPGGPDSGVLSQQGTIAAVTAWNTPFRFLGLGFMLAGIGTMLYVIIQSLALRAEAMRVSLPQILGSGTNSAD